MSFLKRQKRKDLIPQYVDDPAARNNFELITDNLKEIFRRLDKQRYAISDNSTGSYQFTGSLSEQHPSALAVDLDCTGKNPVMVFLRQRPELLSGSNYSSGGINLTNTTVPGGQCYFAIGNDTQRKYIHITLLGGGVSTVSAPILWTIDYPPSAVMAFDHNPAMGINTYKVFFELNETTTTVTIQDCELVAVELF